MSRPWAVWQLASSTSHIVGSGAARPRAPFRQYIGRTNRLGEDPSCGCRVKAQSTGVHRRRKLFQRALQIDTETPDAARAGQTAEGPAEGGASPRVPASIEAANKIARSLSSDATAENPSPADVVALLSALCDDAALAGADPASPDVSSEWATPRGESFRALRSAAVRLVGSLGEAAWAAWPVPEAVLAADRLATLRVETAPELRPLRDRVDGAAETLGEEEAARALYLLTKIGMEMPRLHRRVCNALPDAGNWSPAACHAALWALSFDHGTTPPPSALLPLATAALASHKSLTALQVVEAASAVSRLSRASADALAGDRSADDEGAPASPLIRKAVLVVEERMDEMGPFELAEAARAFGYDWAPRSIWRALTAAVRADLGCFGLGNVIAVLHGMQGARAEDVALLEEVDVWLQRRLDSIGPKGITAAMVAYAKLGRAPHSLLQLAGDAATQKADSFDPPQLARLLWCYATLRVCHRDLMEAACASALRRMGDFDSKAVSNMLWACATLEWTAKDFLEAIGEQAMEVAGSMTPQALAMTIWSFAKLEQCPKPFLQAASRAAQKKLDAFEPQSMSMMLWGYAKMGYNPGPLLWRSQGKVAARLSQMEGQHLANIMWAYATLAHQPGRLMAEAGEEASMRISELKPQEIFMISWAFSKLRYSHEGLLDAVAGELSLRAKDFGAGELTGVLYAFARLGRTLPGSTLLLCGDALVPMVGTLAPQEVSIALWSMAKMNHLNVPLFSTALSDIASRVHIFNPRQLSMIAWACGTVRFHPGEALGAIQGAVCKRLINARPFEITALLWAFVALGEEPMDLLDAIAADPEVIEEFRTSQLPPRNLVEGLWALSATMQYEHPLFPILAASASRVSPGYRLPDTSLVDMAQACSLAKWECPAGQIEFPGKLRRLAMYLATKKTQDVGPGGETDAGRVADVVAQVSRVLGQVGLQHTCWPEIRKTPAPVHVLIEGPQSQQIAVVVEDDVLDYTAGHRQRCGRAAVAQRVLWGAGMDVAPIRASEWRAAVDRKEDPKLMLLSLLEDTAQVKAAATAAGLSVNTHEDV